MNNLQASDLPTPNDLLGIGNFWDGEKAKDPDGKTYWRYMIFTYKDKRTYVLENHIEPETRKINQIVKRLY
jgi:hypothetical protein